VGEERFAELSKSYLCLMFPENSEEILNRDSSADKVKQMKKDFEQFSKLQFSLSSDKIDLGRFQEIIDDANK
jgi:hypothetical protein